MRLYKFGSELIILIFALLIQKWLNVFEWELYDSVAQLAEQYTFNVWVLGPSPSGITGN